MPKRTTERLTKRVIENDKREGFIWDVEVPGFGVRTMESGARTFVIQYRTGSGRQRRMKLGGYPTLTVDKARELARAALVRVNEGKDPADERRTARHAQTVRQLADQYLGDYAKWKGLRPRTIKDARQVLTQHALPHLGFMKVHEVTPSDIRRVHGEAHEVAGPYQANRLRAVLSKMFNLAVRDLARATNPCVGVERFPEDQRWRNFSEAEVTRLLAAADAYPDQNAMDAVRLLLFTGARLQEVLKAEWSQFDLEEGVWEKPSSHTKSRRQHRLGLAGPVLDQLRAMREADPSGRFLFPGKDAQPDPKDPKKDLRRPRSDLKRPWAWLVTVASLGDARTHDLRRTTASFLLDQGFSLPVIGKTLGHTQVSTTNRYAQLRPDTQRDSLRQVGEHMLALRTRREVEVLEEKIAA